MKKIFPFLIVITLFSCSKKSDSNSSFFNVSPKEAFIYDELTITGENIDVMATYTITINNVEATVVNISKTEIKIQIPKGAQNGPLRIVGPQVDETLESINILRTEEAKFYAVTKDANSNSIVQIDINSGEILEIIRTFDFDEFSIDQVRYAPSIDNLVFIGSTSKYESALGKLDLNTNTFSELPTGASVGYDFEIGNNGRLFAISGLIFQIRELSIIDGSPIGDPLYSVTSPDSDGLTRIHYLEAQNKLIFYETIYVNENGSSTPSSLEKQIDLSDNSISTVNYDAKFEDVNISNSIMYSATGNKIGERISGGELQNPIETTFAISSRLDYSTSSERIFFIANKQDMVFQTYFLVRYSINSKSINSVPLADNISMITVVNQ